MKVKISLAKTPCGVRKLLPNFGPMPLTFRNATNQTVIHSLEENISFSHRPANPQRSNPSHNQSKNQADISFDSFNNLSQVNHPSQATKQSNSLHSNRQMPIQVKFERSFDM